MPTPMVDEAGNVWEVDDAGNPVRLVAPAAKGRVFSLPPNPKDVRTEARQAGADARAERSQDRADTTAEVANRLKEQEILLARQKEQREGNTAKDIAGWRANLNNIGLLEGRVKKLRELYDQHFAGKGLQSVAESYAPKGIAPEYGVFEDVGGQMLADMAKAKGLTSQQFNTPVEQRMFFEPMIPKRGDTDEQILNKLDYLDQMVATGRRTTEENLGINHQKADNEVPDPTTGADLKPPPTDNSPDGLPPANDATTGAASGKSRATYDPRMSSQIDAMINAGASKGMVDAVLKRQNFPVVTPGEWSAIQEWRRKSPGKKYYGANISRNDDLSYRQRFAGSALGSGLAHAADAGTGGLVSLASGEEGRGALDAMSALHPTASTVGDVAGGIGGALATEAAVAARAPAALVKYAPRVADALYGGGLGFNTAREGEGLKGAALGAGAGFAGGLIGQKAMSGAGRIARGVQDANVGYLLREGIPLTVGQTLGGSGWLGNAIRGAEDRISGFWGAGDAVKNRYREGVEAVADRMANDAVAPVGGTSTGYGQATVDDLLQQGGDAYGRATAGAHVPLDPQFGTDMRKVRAMGGILPDDLSGRFSQAINNRVGPVEADTYLTGDTFQQAVRGLKGYRAEATKPGFEQDYRDALSEGIDALRGQMNRGGGEDVVENLANADQAWKRIKIFQKATEAARNGARSGEVGLPMPSHFNDAALAASKKYGGPRFNAELLDAAQRVLPSKVPDSGTAGRIGFGTMLLGGTAAGAGAGGLAGDAGTGAQTGLGLTLLLAAGGSKPAQKAMVRILADRPDLAIRIGNKIIDNSSIGGWTGAGALAPLFVEP